MEYTDKNMWDIQIVTYELFWVLNEISIVHSQPPKVNKFKSKRK